jgi:hypothetical protein
LLGCDVPGSLIDVPKRTNAFQKLVHLLNEQLSPLATVTESKELYDPTAKTMREIDVLIEVMEGETAHRVGIECRDHKNRQDVIWVEGVVTKHRDLGLDKSILVSATPFTRAAEEKAATHGISLVSMSEALKTDWTSLLGDASTLWWAEWNATITKVEATLSAGGTAPIAPDLIAYTAEGQAIGELGPLLRGKLSEVNVLEGVAPNKTGTGTISMKPVPSVWVEDTSGIRREICEFTMSFTWKTPARVPLSIRKGRLLNRPVAFGVGVASVSQGGPLENEAPKEDKKIIEVHFIKTSENEAVSTARVLHPGGKVEEAKMAPVKPR